MSYENWTEYPYGQPDFYQHPWGYKESCINIWPQYNYGWNDEPCEFKHCFVCEVRILNLRPRCPTSPQWDFVAAN